MDLDGGELSPVDTALVAPFGDGEFRFWLPMPQVIELERSCDRPIMAMEARLRDGIGQGQNGEVVFIGGAGATVQEVRETIRLALIGGNSAMIDGSDVGVGPVRAKQLVDLYVYPARPLEESAVLAWRILSTAVFGVRLKKKAGAPEDQPPKS